MPNVPNIEMAKDDICKQYGKLKFFLSKEQT